MPLHLLTTMGIEDRLATATVAVAAGMTPVPAALLWEAPGRIVQRQDSGMKLVVWLTPPGEIASWNLKEAFRSFNDSCWCEVFAARTTVVAEAGSEHVK